MLRGNLPVPHPTSRTTLSSLISPCSMIFEIHMSDGGGRSLS